MPKGKEAAPIRFRHGVKFDICQDSHVWPVINAFKAHGVDVSVQGPDQHEDGPLLGNPFAVVVIEDSFRATFVEILNIAEPKIGKVADIRGEVDTEFNLDVIVGEAIKTIGGESGVEK